jgi:hypothetical protein
MIGRPRKLVILSLHEGAVRVGAASMVGVYVIGLTTGWALAQWSSAPIGAAIGGFIGTAFVTWIIWTYRRTGGTLSDPTRDAVERTESDIG